MAANEITDVAICRAVNALVTAVHIHKALSVGGRDVVLPSFS